MLVLCVFILYFHANQNQNQMNILKIKILQASISAMVIIAVGSCGGNREIVNSGWSEGCPLERLDWMKVSEGYDSQTVIELAAKLEAAAKVDAAAIQGIDEGSASVDFSSSLKKAIESTSSSSIEVSQLFYETYTQQRLSICALYQALTSDPPIYQSADARAKAEDAYTEVAKSFAKVKEEEEKKN